MSKETSFYTFEVAHDGGNGYMKDSLNGKHTVFPSVLAMILPGNQPNAIEDVTAQSLQNFGNTFLDQMDVTIQSPSLNNNARYLVGQKAIESGLPTITFNISSTEGKSSSDVSLVSLFSLLSYSALKKYIDANKTLPSELEVNVSKMVTALPIEEAKIESLRKQYESRFTSNSHIVIVNNFANPITVKLSFNHVQVLPEGVISQYALVGSATNLQSFRNDDIFREFRKEYNLPNFNGKDIVSIGNVLNIDIGEGTVDMSVMKNAAPIPQSNFSIYQGVGNAIENAALALHQQYPMLGIINRQSFMEIASRDDSQESQTYRAFLENQLIALEEQISEKIKTIYSRTNSQIKLVTISGGGSAVLKNHYKTKLNKLLDSLSPFGAAPVFWVPTQHTQLLNLEGLEFRLSLL